MLGLPRRWIRQLYYLVGFFAIALILIVVANNQNVISQSIQARIPYFKQPEAVIVDLDIETCYKYSKNCGLGSEWYRVPKDLYLGSAWSSKGYLFSKRIKREALVADQLVVVDLAVYDNLAAKLKGNGKAKLPLAVLKDLYNVGYDTIELVKAEAPSVEASVPQETSAPKTKRDAVPIDYPIPTKEQLEKRGWESRSNGLWIRRDVYNSKASLTAIDVLFGVDAVDPRPDWTLLKSALDFESDLPAYITFRKGPGESYVKPKLKVNQNGKFKILQVADLHFSTGEGECRDPFPASSAEGCKADPRTLKFLNQVLDIEQPDFVVLTGDQIFGESSLDSGTSLLKALAPFIERKIPFAVTLGNHDDEGSMSRQEVMELSSYLPYSLSSVGPEGVDGVGNYVLTVQGPSSKNPAMALYFLDTHKYSPNPKVNPGYDWIKESQIKFLEKSHNDLRAGIEAYTHIHLPMAFFHIPLPEYRNVPNQIVIGNVKEGVTAPRYNTGARTVLGQIGVKVVSVGHDHCNDYCLMDIEKNKYKEDEINKMWLCYGGASGEGGYSGYGGTARRLRIYEINTQSNDIRSWKRIEGNVEEVVDSQVLVSGGQVVQS